MRARPYALRRKNSLQEFERIAEIVAGRPSGPQRLSISRSPFPTLFFNARFAALLFGLRRI
jgi:hypothetical protein